MWRPGPENNNVWGPEFEPTIRVVHLLGGVLQVLMTAGSRDNFQGKEKEQVLMDPVVGGCSW